MNLGQLQSLSKGWFPNLKLPFTSWGQVISVIQEGTLSSGLTRLLCQPKVSTISSVKTIPSCYVDASQGPAFLLQEWKQCHQPSHWHALASAPHRWIFFWWSDVQKIEAKYLHTVLCSNYCFSHPIFTFHIISPSLNLFSTMKFMCCVSIKILPPWKLPETLRNLPSPSPMLGQRYSPNPQHWIWHWPHGPHGHRSWPIWRRPPIWSRAPQLWPSPGKVFFSQRNLGRSWVLELTAWLNLNLKQNPSELETPPKFKVVTPSHPCDLRSGSIGPLLVLADLLTQIGGTKRTIVQASDHGGQPSLGKWVCKKRSAFYITTI